MTFSAARLTCYALLSAIEEDLRDLLLIAARNEDSTRVLHSKSRENALVRYARDEGPSSGDPALVRLLPYVDFPDLIASLNRYRTKLDENQANLLKSWSPHFEKLVPVRNRVAHSRPLDLGDLASVLDIADLFLSERGLPWPTLGATQRRLQKDPSYVLNLEIRFPNVERSTKRHNLPLPDFDDTGLLGRKNAEQSVLSMLRGAYPVISIVGDGGVGKTALALKAAYDLLDDPERPFEAVVWTTAKSRQLTNTEITKIGGAIQDSLGMLTSAAEQLGGLSAKENPLEEVLSYMKSFRILLVLDNLETVLDQRLRDFLTQLPQGSKVLITSRIGLGALENPLKLPALEKQHALALLRSSAKVRGVKSLATLPDETLARFVGRMKAHPLYIKWFVSVVQAGRRPEEALRDSSTILDYCMSNVYEYLRTDGRQVLRSLQALPGLHSQAELAYLNRMDADAVQPAVAELITTNFVNWQSVAVGGGVSTEYEVTEFAQTYLDRRHPLSEFQRRDLNSRRDALLSEGQRLANAHAADPFEPTTLEIRGAGDFSVASKLVNALSLRERGDSGLAIALIHEAQSLSPDYHEAYRIEALLHDLSGDIGKARQCFETALENAEESVPLLHHYGHFLMGRSGETDRGLQMLQRAASLRPGNHFLHLEVATAHLQIGDPQTAANVGWHVIEGEGVRADLSRRAARLIIRATAATMDQQVNVDNYESAAEAVDELCRRLPTLMPYLDPVALRRVIQCAELADACARGTQDGFIANRAAACAIKLREVAPHDGSSLRYAKIREVKQDQAFGFLSIPGSQADLFFHKSSVRPRGSFVSLRPGDEVCFKEGLDRQGRNHAVEVSVLDE